MTEASAVSGHLLADTVLAGQRPSGAFTSAMTDGEVQTPDENSFTTARVLDALGGLAEQPRLRAAAQRAISFLASCEAPELPGTYRFWPDAQRPAHVPRYPPDTDDTVLVSLVLLRHHAMTRDQLRRLVAHTLLSHRVPPGRRPARWIQPGAFMTWLDHDWPYNIVDCTVNANVVRLICQVGLRGIRGYEEACGTISAGVAAAAGDPVLLRLLSPYYATPLDLRDAVRRAVSAGAAELRPALEQLSRQLPRTCPPADVPVCTSAYGKITWTSDLLRRIEEGMLKITDLGDARARTQNYCQCRSPFRPPEEPRDRACSAHSACGRHRAGRRHGEGGQLAWMQT